jgi:hypothetical protein
MFGVLFAVSAFFSRFRDRALLLARLISVRLLESSQSASIFAMMAPSGMKPLGLAAAQT